MPRRCAVALLAAAALIGSSGSAAADSDFDRAKELLDNLDFEKAEAAFEKALENGGNDPATTARIYLHLGEISASTGDDDKAVERFRKALSIDINASLPKGTSPKVGKPFGAARRAIEDPLAAKVVLSQKGKQGTVRATLEIASDVTEMVRAAEVTYQLEGGEKTSAELRIKGAKTPLLLPARVESITVAVLDRRGNRLVELEPVTLEADAGGGTRDPGPGNGNGNGGSGGGAGVSGQVDTGGSFITRWYLWGGLAVAAAATGVGFGLSTRSTLDELDELKQMSPMVEGSEALALEDKARSRALIANISFAAAGAFAIAAGIFFFTSGGDAPAKEESSLSLTPSLGPDRIGVVSTLRF
jgi:hypothetical protein